MYDDRPAPSELTDEELEDAISNVRGCLDQDYYHVGQRRLWQLQSDLQSLLEEQRQRNLDAEQEDAEV